MRIILPRSKGKVIAVMMQFFLFSFGCFLTCNFISRRPTLIYRSYNGSYMHDVMKSCFLGSFLLQRYLFIVTYNGNSD